jgi:TPR repeat protein
MDQAKTLRDDGAALFQQSDFQKALPKFTEALGLLEKVSATDDVARQALLISCALNSASCCVKLEQFEDAVKYASQVISLDRKNCKAYYRRGQANVAMKLFSKARVDLMIASELAAGSDQEAAIKDELAKLKDLETAAKKSGAGSARAAPTPAAPPKPSSAPSDVETMYKQMMAGGVDLAALGAPKAATAAPSEPAVTPPALEALKAQADGGDVAAMLTIGDHFEQGTSGAKKHPTEAFRWYTKAASTGDAKAMSYAAWCHKTGFGTPVNLPEAIRLYRQAAEKGLVKAQACLGYLYEKGEGVAANPAEAVRYYALAAEQGDAASQINLGLMYEKGTGVAKDPVLALKWFTASAEQGNLSACINVGVAYEKGQGVAKDMACAFGWYLRAAKAGDHTAQAITGCCFEKGLGVEQDQQTALMWYERSARQGNQHAREGLKRLLNVQ